MAFSCFEHKFYNCVYACAYCMMHVFVLIFCELQNIHTSVIKTGLTIDRQAMRQGLFPCYGSFPFPIPYSPFPIPYS